MNPPLSLSAFDTMPEIRQSCSRDALLDFRVNGAEGVIPDLLTMRAEGEKILVPFQDLEAD